MPPKFTSEEFIERAIKVHGDKYNYSKVEYIDINTKINIICNKEEHYIFSQRPRGHLSGNGCPKCKTLSNQDFLNKSKLIHGNKYDYSKVKYINAHFKVIIRCKNPEHGEFEQTPASHLSGRGCKFCARENHEGHYSLNKSLRNYYNLSGCLYVIKMYNNEELFIKIGVSKNYKQRFSRLMNESKYNIEEISITYYKNFNEAIIKEHELHEKYKDYSYLPKNKFGGRNECFNEEIRHFH